MKERPILFSGPMVRAILRDIDPKTQTRRELTPLVCHFGSAPLLFWQHADLSRAWVDGDTSDSQYLHVPCHVNKRGECKVCDEWDWPNTSHRLWPNIAPAHEWDQSPDPRCGYKPPASVLWVRETWNALQAGSWTEHPRAQKGMCEVRYAATDALADLDAETRGYRWRPSIHMPRWASRINLEVKKVRVEHLCDISDHDGKAEGYDGRDSFLGGDWARPMRDANPWVWVIEFKRVEVPR